MTTQHRGHGAAKPWGEFETLALREFYPRHGSQWEGWDDVLPNRTRHAIADKAARLSVRAAPKTTRGTLGTSVDTGPTPPSEYEKTVTRLMERGMSPTQIDTKMHWVRGTTVAILTNRWKGDDSGI